MNFEKKMLFDTDQSLAGGNTTAPNTVDDISNSEKEDDDLGEIDFSKNIYKRLERMGFTNLRNISPLMIGDCLAHLEQLNIRPESLIASLPPDQLSQNPTTVFDVLLKQVKDKTETEITDFPKIKIPKKVEINSIAHYDSFKSQEGQDEAGAEGYIVSEELAIFLKDPKVKKALKIWGQGGTISRNSESDYDYETVCSELAVDDYDELENGPFDLICGEKIESGYRLSREAQSRQIIAFLEILKHVIGLNQTGVRPRILDFGSGPSVHTNTMEYKTPDASRAIGLLSKAGLIQVESVTMIDPDLSPYIEHQYGADAYNMEVELQDVTFNQREENHDGETLSLGSDNTRIIASSDIQNYSNKTLPYTFERTYAQKLAAKTPFDITIALFPHGALARIPVPLTKDGGLYVTTDNQRREKARSGHSVGLYKVTHLSEKVS